MKLIKYLTEEWKTTLSFGKDSTGRALTLEIFKNPKNFEEPPRSGGFIRGVLDEKGDLYVWDGNTDYLHNDVAERMKFDFEELDDIPLYFYKNQNRVEISYWDAQGSDVAKMTKTHKARVAANRNVQRYINTIRPNVTIEQDY